MPKTNNKPVIVNVVCPVKLREELEKHVDKLNAQGMMKTSLSAIAREAIIEYLDRHKI